MAVRTLSSPKVTPTAAVTEVRASTEVYKRFFIAGITTVLTVGCMLGAIALLGISLQGTYASSDWSPYIMAHANSQLYGFVGFFVIGFALQNHAPRLSRLKLFNRMAWSSLVLIAIGIASRFVAEPLAGSDRAVGLPLGIASASLQAIGVILFVVNNTVTRFKTGQGLTWQSKLVFASLFWWLVVSIADPYFFAMSHQASQIDSIMFVAQWFPAMRDAQFLGFVSLMIFGVALVKVNSCFGGKQPVASVGDGAFWLWNCGIIGHAAGWVLYFRSGFQPGQDILLQIGSVLLAAGAISVATSSRAFEKLSEKMVSHKFIRTSLAWLLITGILFLMQPMHLRLIGVPFSHAYLGAVRHALTVGFIAQMIIGVSIHVVGQMNDVPTSLEPALWTTFWLLNIGNALRVGLQIATDYTHSAFSIMGISGLLELTGIFFWAAAMIAMMVKKSAYRKPVSTPCL